MLRRAKASASSSWEGLQALTLQQTAQQVSAAFDNAELGEDLARDIFGRTSGLPAFIEQACPPGSAMGCQRACCCTRCKAGATGLPPQRQEGSFRLLQAGWREQTASHGLVTPQRGCR